MHIQSWKSSCCTLLKVTSCGDGIWLHSLATRHACGNICCFWLECSKCCISLQVRFEGWCFALCIVVCPIILPSSPVGWRFKGTFLVSFQGSSHYERGKPSTFYHICDVKGGQILIVQGWTKLAPTPVWAQAFSRQLTIFWDIFDFSVSSLSCDSQSCHCNHACTCCNYDHELWTTWAGFCVCPRTMCLPLTSHMWYTVPGSPPP